MKYLPLILLFSCKPSTPAQEVYILRAELAIASTKCSVYTTGAKFPRDTIVTDKCNKLLKP